MAWRLPNFTEVGRLGGGATGTVVSARHDTTGTVVAIKYLADPLRTSSTFMDQFRSEARLLVDVDDPNVARLYEYVETAEGAAIVMELVDGIPLADLLGHAGPTEPEAALVVLKGALQGLVAAHAKGVVHRDFKPANVLIDTEGTSKLVDFGIAVRAGRQAPTAGTPQYMAPEQWSGASATARTDLYAATATFFECLTGRPPYAGASGLVGLRLAHESAPVPLGAVPEQVRELVARGLAKDPSQRPADAASLLADVERVARTGYGPAWEHTGAQQLVRRLAPLLLLQKSATPGRGPGRAVTSFVGGRRATRVLTAAALAAALIIGIDMVVTGTGAAAPTTPAGASFVATFDASPGASGAPPAIPAPGIPTGTPTPRVIQGQHTPTVAPPPGSTTRPATHPAPPPHTGKTTAPAGGGTTPVNPPPTTPTTPPPPPPTFEVTSVTVEQWAKDPTDPSTFDYAINVHSNIDGQITLTVNFYIDSTDPPFGGTTLTPQGGPIDLQGGGTDNIFTGSVTFDPAQCATSFVGIQASSSPSADNGTAASSASCS